MSNVKHMSLEEKLIQHIKDDKLITMIGDEDALIELTRRAVTQALFEPRLDPKNSSSYNPRMLPSPAVEAAQSAAQTLAKRLIDEIMEDAAVKKKIVDAVAAALPKAIQDHVYGSIHNLVEISAANAMAQVREAIANKII